MQEQTILVAEDDPSIAELLRYGLEYAGYGVEVAHDGWDAWERIQDRTFDVIVTDEWMPRWNGVELCRAMRNLPEYVTTPVIFTTGNPRGMNPGGLEELRVTAVFHKPFYVRDLAEKVRVSLSQKTPKVAAPCVCLA